jgi:hypothetical protein
MRRLAQIADARCPSLSGSINERSDGAHSSTCLVHVVPDRGIPAMSSGRADDGDELIGPRPPTVPQRRVRTPDERRLRPTTNAWRRR